MPRVAFDRNPKIRVPGPWWVGCLIPLILPVIHIAVYLYVVSYSKQTAVLAPLNAAAARGDITEMRRLLSQRVNVNEVSRYFGFTPLHSATAAGQPEAVRVLLTAHANVNARDDQLATPLHRASQAPNARALDSRNRVGRNAAVLILLENGADPNLTDSSGQTPLHNAVSGRDVPLIKILLDHGADPTIKDSQGARPIDLVPIFLRGADAQLAKEYLERAAVPSH